MATQLKAGRVGNTKHVLTRRRFVGAAMTTTLVAPYISRGATSAGFEIGLVADAQYADVEPKGTRYYRASVSRLGEAVEHFNGRELGFCVHLGDLIDRAWKSFDEISKPLTSSRHRWHHLLGNHDFQVLDEQKQRVPDRLGMKARYGSFEYGGFRFLVLDTNDVSVYAHPAGSPMKESAERELARLQAAKVAQAKPWNGAIGPRQLGWMDRSCKDAQVNREKVIVLAHHPVFPAGGHNVWNADEVLALVERHRHVVAWLNGHNHAGAFGERGGVPYVTMKGMVETAATTAFATARILPDRLVITGHGREPARELKFRAG